MAPPPAAAVDRAPPARSPVAWRLFASLAFVLAGLVLAAGIYVPRLYFEETDDAYVHADIVSVIPKLAAYVVELRVTDNSPFRKGEVLIELDPRDFENAVDSCIAKFAAAQAARADTQAMIEEQADVIGRAEAALSGDRATTAFAKEQLSRYSQLADTGYGSQQRMQQAQSDIGQREAELRRDEAQVAQAKAHLKTLRAQSRERDADVARADAQLAQARLDLSYTKLSATADGSVANRHVEVGNFVQPGQLLLSAVPDDVYVFANFKETQIGRMRVGQTVLIDVDALPDVTLHGHIDSFQRGTGSVFALLPPENATGNFVKVVQRVPVKIRFDEPADVLRRISPGMSVETTVAVGTPPRWLAWTASLL